MDPASEHKLATVNPGLAAKARALDGLYQNEYPFDALTVVQGFRSWSQQETLWLKGRDAQGNIADPRLVVTHALPGHSWHEFGLAIDLCPKLFLGRPGWDTANPIWTQIGKWGESLGLVWGGRWAAQKRDQPHFQLTGHLPVSPDNETRQVYAAGGVFAVWDAAKITNV